MRTPLRWFVFVACLLCSRWIGAEPALPKTDNPEARAAKLLVRLLETESLGKRAIDDARAKQLLQSFMALLDPQKVILLQSERTEPNNTTLRILKTAVRQTASRVTG